ncbi:MAG: SPFH/Band 7/PHB domain protein [Acidimicrobiia bacterium]|nr:SPFH/Band 7/PHB domain protein [Acidimicrobiia bacterium]MDH4309933.1 SPFH/Band 7/PHB domain protein [Acidimicrobiia bacterium]
MPALLALFAVLFILLVVVLAASIKIVRPFEKGLVETLGRYNKTVDSGLRLIMPFIQTLAKVDMREQVVDVPPQEVITRDNVVVTVDAVIYYEATDPVKLKYNVGNFVLAVTKLAQTNLRNVVGDLDLDAALTSREVINTKLREILDDATDKWGTRVVRVEIQRIEPPADVTEAMHRQMKAERDRRAVVTEAEGEKTARILRAEGVKESNILEAEGQAEAIKRVADADRYQKLTVAEGEAQAITTVYGAIHEGDPTPDLITIKYLEALQGVANGKATKIFLPLDTSGVLGSVAAIGELFKEGNGGAASAEPAAVPKRSGGDRTPPGPTAAQQMPPASAPRPDQPGR